MARPTKQGIDYFPYDVDLDQDDKLQMIIGEFGFKGEFIYTKLLAWIYKNNGYYTEWNEMEQLKFAKRVSYMGGALVNLVHEVVAGCIKWGLFDKTVFESFSILTSVRIQKTWFDASRKRKDREIDPKIWLDVVIDAAEAEETQLIPPETPQSKVKKSKVKKKREEEGAPAPKKNLEEKQSDMRKRRKQFGDTLVPFIATYGKEMIREFFDYWTEPNKSETRFKMELEDTWNLERRLSTWEKNDHKFGSKKNGHEPNELLLKLKNGLNTAQS